MGSSLRTLQRWDDPRCWTALLVICGRHVNCGCLSTRCCIMNSRPPQMIETHLPLPVPGAHWQWVCIEGDGTCATAPAAPADRQPADRPFWARQIMRGQIVGYYEDSADVAHGFRYSGGNYTTLDDPLATGVDFRFAQLDHEAAQPAAPVFPAQTHALASRAAGHRLSTSARPSKSGASSWPLCSRGCHKLSVALDRTIRPLAHRSRAVAGASRFDPR